MVLWVAERIRSEAPELPLFFAVDDELLAEPLRAAGFETILTSKEHPSGTDRIAEANKIVDADFVVNVQADEPLVTGAQLRMLAELIGGDAEMATLATPFKRAEDFMNPNQVKVVFSPVNGRALYFSRLPIPYARNLMGAVDDEWVRQNRCFKHLGLYAYQADLLRRFASLPMGAYEELEKLEQLRVLENGFGIVCGVTNEASIGVDTPEDAGKFEAYLGAE